MTVLVIAIGRYRLRTARACAVRIMPRRYAGRFLPVNPPHAILAVCGSIDSLFLQTGPKLSYVNVLGYLQRIRMFMARRGYMPC